MTNVAWPAALKPSSFGFKPLNFDTSGGQSTAGGEQFIASPGPRWSAEMTLPVWNDEQVLALRALRSKLQGRANPVMLPNFDGRRVSWPIEAGTGRVLTPAVAHQLAGTYMLEDTAYGGAEIPAAAEINATVHPGAAVGATQLTIRVAQGGPIKEGQQFGLTHAAPVYNRLYEIATIDSTTVGTGVTDYLVTFKPRLRALAADGSTVQFSRPLCLMRCTNMSDELGALEMLRFATLNLQFVEYL